MDEGVGKGEWKKVAELFERMKRSRSSSEMREIIRKAEEITEKLSGLDRCHAEKYLESMRRTLARWRILEREGII